jgi:hydroxymethylbilane synthase
VTQAVRVGTRGSPLALVQAHAVCARLRDHGVDTSIVVIATAGDHLAEQGPQSSAPAGSDGKRLFVKEIQDALLAETIDLAVHSSKDMPATSPGGLRIAATLPREDPRDAVILSGGRDSARFDSAGLTSADFTGAGLDSARLDSAGLDSAALSGTALSGTALSDAALETLQTALASALGAAPRIGTSSVRRIAQLRAVLRDAAFLPVRGNLGTRLGKLDAGAYDALVLAAAGLRRLGQEARISCLLPVALCVPAPGQGILAVEVREGDRAMADAASQIGDRDSTVALAAEQAVVRRLEGGCQMPIGAYAQVDGLMVTLHCVVISPDGSRFARTVARGEATTPAAVGSDAAAALLAQGAGDILADVHRGRVSNERGRA